MKATLNLFLVSCCALVCGCMLKFSDVSKETEFAPLINTCYSLKTNMFITGATSDRFYKPPIDIYFIEPMDSATTDRGNITRNILQQGTILKVQRIMRSAEYISGNITRVMVEVTPFIKSVDVPVVVALVHLQSTNYMNKLNGTTNDYF